MIHSATEEVNGFGRLFVLKVQLTYSLEQPIPKDPKSTRIQWEKKEHYKDYLREIDSVYQILDRLEIEGEDLFWVKKRVFTNNKKPTFEGEYKGIYIQLRVISTILGQKWLIWCEKPSLV